MGTLGDDDLTAPEARFDIAEAAALLLDRDGVITCWSAGAERLLGHPSAEVLGRSAVSLLAPEHREHLASLMRQRLADSGWSGAVSGRRRDGSRIPVRVRLVTLTPRHGPGSWLVLLVGAYPQAGWGLTRHALEHMVEQSPVGIALVDTDLRYVWSNGALARFGGGPPEYRVGRRIADVQPSMNAEGIEAQMRRVLRTGAPVLDYEHVGHPRSDPDREHAHSMSFFRLEDSAGKPVGIYYTVIDITDRYRAVRRLSLLDRASDQIGRTLDVVRTAQELADVAVPHLADFVTVDLLDSVLRGGEPSAGPLREPALVPLRRGGHQSVREGVPEAAVEPGSLATYRADSPPVRSLTSGRSWRQPRLDPDDREWATHLPGGRAERFGDLGFRSAMVVPIRARGVTLGVTAFFRLQRTETFEEDDLSLAEEFVARAAVCLDNARRYTREREAAQVLQRSLLPRGLPEHDAVDVATWYRTADEEAGVVGDWVDVLPLSGARVALVAGDVVGQGVEAAAIMARLRTAVQTLADLDLPPDEVLAHLDDLVVRMARAEGDGRPGHAGRTDTVGAGDAAAEPGPGEGCKGGPAHRERHGRPGGTGCPGRALGTSCLYVVFDPVGLRCTAAGAGHSPPAVLGPDGRVRFPDLPTGPALGVGGLPFESADFALEEGSVLALYTSGLLAGTSPGPDGEPAQERLRHAMEGLGPPERRRRPPLEQLGRAVVDELVSGQPVDDVALLLVGIRRLNEGRVATWDLADDPAVVAQAREAAMGQLAHWGLEELAFTTELVVSELVTNAIRHATGPIRLRLIHAHALICEVSDCSSTSPRLRHPRTSDEGGRGLFLVSQLAERWGTRYTADGKVIWTEQSLSGAEPAP